MDSDSLATITTYQKFQGVILMIDLSETDNRMHLRKLVGISHTVSYLMPGYWKLQ